MDKHSEKLTGRGLLTDSIRSDGEYAQLVDALKSPRRKNLPFMVSGLCEGAADSLCAALAEDLPDSRPVLLLCSEEKDCLRLQDVFASCGMKAVFYPSRDLNFHNMVSSREFEQTRLGALVSLLRGEADAVITTPDAAALYTIPPGALRDSVFDVGPSYSRGPDGLCSDLVRAGYIRSDMAEGPGQFSRRGGIVDVCIPAAGADGRCTGVRTEFFGDEPDRVCFYDPSTQRVTRNAGTVTVPPAREVIPSRDALKAIRVNTESLLKKAGDPHLREELESELSSVTAAIESGSELLFSDRYVSLCYPEKASLKDYLGNSSLCVICGSGAVRDRLKASEWQSAEQAKSLVSDGLLPGKYAGFSVPAQALLDFAESRPCVLTESLVQGMSGQRLGGVFAFRSRQSVCCAGNPELLKEELRSFAEGGYRIVLMTSGKTQAANYEGLIGSWDIPARAAAEADGSDVPLSLSGPGTVTVMPSAPVAPFELASPRIAVISIGTERSGLRTKPARHRSKKDGGAGRILSYADLRVGDYVVHETHGIGIFMGITTMNVGGASADYITIQYAGSDRLFMPVDKLDKVSKYIGAHSDDGSLKLSRFGGTEWGRTKARTKASLKNIARELISLYAERKRRPGFAFPKDDEFQRDFEAAFEFEETEAQLQSADEIKRDMTSPVPMDRLLCGDVGYGKTEVAFRAIYKAILGGKQVAMLVPTTILAMQHYQTACSRMRAFPVNVETISRFVPAKKQKQIRDGLARGDVDLVIGTHRLLSEDIKFRDLGLLVIDEEQRFGVAQKEKIKQRAGNIDVLSLSATPIPRTLNMAMTGIRDISLLDEAPGDRLPVQTYVLEHDDLIITEAVRRELRRGGQVFYLYNFIESIDAPAAKLKAAIPEANIVVAHGKMEKEQLEDIWMRMTDGEIDVLVCTTIIETGVDIPNANTLIVENAHRMGLSQLHQIRGRVGRSPRRAYAYFTFPKGRALTEIAQKRLEAIRDYAEFGAGFQIAIRDLEIRGAGSVLGAEQHGHLDSVGYDMYIKLLEEAVLEEKGETVKERPECTVSLTEDAYLPDSYVPSSAQRMALYKRISRISSEEDRDELLDELCDRYGDPPQPASNLLDIALLRAEATKCGILSVSQNGTEIRITPEKLDMPVWQKVSGLTGGRIRAFPAASPYLVLSLRRRDDPLIMLAEIFRSYLKFAG